MHKYFFILSTFVVTINHFAFAQSVKILQEGKRISFRGLSVVDDRVVWASGSGGTVALSVDAGQTWKYISVKGYEKTDFRDIEAFDGTTAVIMGIDSPAVILRTIDAGATWDPVYKDTTSGMFLDAMEFWNINSGIVIGDPIKGRFFIGRTFDGGRTWRTIPMENRPHAEVGEACFASSGTNIRKLNQAEAIFVSGGKQSRVFIRDKTIPLFSENAHLESTGANSIAIKNEKCYMIAGGDFAQKDDTTFNLIYTSDGGMNWQHPIESPHGYRSCVEYLYKKTWVTCGLNGVDITTDDGAHFQSISTAGFHVCRKAKKGKAVYFAGGNGRIGRLEKR